MRGLSSYRAIPVLAALGLLAAVAGFFATDLWGQQHYAGTIAPCQHGLCYTLPPGTEAVWRRPPGDACPQLGSTFPAVVRIPINTSAVWDGTPGPDPMRPHKSYFDRYQGGTNDLTQCGYSLFGGKSESEKRCGLAEKALTVLLGRTPSRQEFLDFCIAHGGVVKCPTYTLFTGLPYPPDCAVDGQSDLRFQPSTPLGCCKISNPCTVEDASREPGVAWAERVATPQGGVKLCYLVSSAQPQPVPSPTPELIPTPTPQPTPEPTPVPTPSPTPTTPPCLPVRSEPVPAACDQAVRALAGKPAPGQLTWGEKRAGGIVECRTWLDRIAVDGAYVPGVRSTAQIGQCLEVQP